MNYIEFRKIVEPFTVFSLVDIRQVEPVFHRRRLNEWQEKGYIKKVIKGYYISSDTAIDEKVLFEIANRIYAPSYVSFEMALAYYGLIPESVYGITSASTRKTSRFKTSLGTFIYRAIRPRLYFGFDFVKNKGKVFKIAYPEKALLDLFYIRTDLCDVWSFEALRINRDVFFKLLNQDKIKDYLNVYGLRSLKRRLSDFWSYIKDA